MKVSTMIQFFDSTKGELLLAFYESEDDEVEESQFVIGMTPEDFYSLLIAMFEPRPSGMIMPVRACTFGRGGKIKISWAVVKNEPCVRLEGWKKGGPRFRMNLSTAQSVFEGLLQTMNNLPNLTFHQKVEAQRLYAEAFP